MHKHGNLLRERPYAKGLQLNITGVMGKILVCYRVAEEDLGVIVDHKPSLPYRLQCGKECLNHLGGRVCPAAPVNI